MAANEDASLAILKLEAYCRDQGYKGWDPYDGLNSRIFRATPLKNWDIARLVLIQLCKRSPINLRPFLLVPKQHNAKGIGLLLNGYCNLVRLAEGGDERYGTLPVLLSRVVELADLLLDLQSHGYSGACWGYNFGWQARRLFYFPAHTPTVVATSFCASALFNAADVTGDKRYEKVAITSGDFILNDLHRTECEAGFLFSYSPLQGNDTVYNAALLGAKTLSYCFKYTGDFVYREAARAVVSAVCEGQESDGSWVYGLLPVQSWKDSFHTGYNLDAIAHYQNLCNDDSFKANLDKGYEYYRDNFFLDDGMPKYYDNKIWPIDIHCPGQLWVTASALDRWDETQILAHRTLKWTLENMYSPIGFFYYQIKKIVSSKISYMRWSNAFMFNALSYYLLEERDSLE